jgi:hypothetical protein
MKEKQMREIAWPPASLAVASGLSAIRKEGRLEAGMVWRIPASDAAVFRFSPVFL